MLRKDLNSGGSVIMMWDCPRNLIHLHRLKNDDSKYLLRKSKTNAFAITKRGRYRGLILAAGRFLIRLILQIRRATLTFAEKDYLLRDVDYIFKRDFF